MHDIWCIKPVSASFMVHPSQSSMDDHLVRRTIQQELRDVALPLRQLLSGHGFKEGDADVRSLTRLAVLRLNLVEEWCPQMSGMGHLVFFDDAFFAFLTVFVVVVVFPASCDVTAPMMSTFSSAISMNRMPCDQCTMASRRQLRWA